jgi:hypothetical protein
MATERLLVRDAIGGFAPGQIFRAVLLLTYSFDGAWLEEIFIPDLFDRPVASALVIRDRNAVVNEARNVRYHRANAVYSNRTFHSKLGLFIGEDRALAVIGSANLTRGGLERNLELGSVFEVSPDGGPRGLFQSFLDYVAGPLTREVAGASETAVRDTVAALREVLQLVPRDEEGPRTFLHNYERVLWEQVMEALPHRHVAKVSIISPFFEPNGEASEDPTGQGGDEGVFARLFKDLAFEPPKGERPVSVFFQQSEGNTQLPVDKLKAWKHQLDLRQRLSTTADEPRPLHGKMLIIEGAKGRKREPYLVTVFGSPNFTSAALLSRPPEGNAEIAVLTYLPSRRNATHRIWSALGLDRLFGEVKDWSTLHHVVSPRPPMPSVDAFRVNDASLRVADRKLVVIWHGSTSAASQLRILIEVNGVWTTVSSTALGAETRAELDVPALIQTDNAGLVSVRAALIRVELLDRAGNVVAVSDAPVNVDCPQQFCGCAMVGQLMATLDQRIAFAGCGIAQTYREQLKFLEQHRGKDRQTGKKLAVLTHQADLDRFFRNLNAGFRGVRARSEAMRNSEYTLRHSVRDLDRWFQEVLLLDGQVPTNECRLFLIDRLGRALQYILDVGQNSKVLAPKLAGVVREFHVATALKAASEWVESIHDERLDDYIGVTTLRLNAVADALNKLAGK